MKKEKELGKVIIFTEETQLHIGDYFRAYRSKYYTLVKEIIENQRNYEDGYGEYYTTMVKVNIFNKEEKLLAEDSIVPIERIISGALAKYIPDLNYDPTYLGMCDPYKYQFEHKIWKNMTKICFDYTNKVFPYVGAIGTTVCDRWKCFEYFFADLRHMDGYNEAKKNSFNSYYIVDLYDIQKHIHPSKRIYAPGYVKLKPFKDSDMCRYYNLPININTYPKDLDLSIKYMNKELDPIETLYKKQSGMNIVLDLSTADYYYNESIGYQPLVARNLHYSGNCNYCGEYNKKQTVINNILNIPGIDYYYNESIDQPLVARNLHYSCRTNHDYRGVSFGRYADYIRDNNALYKKPECKIMCTIVKE